MPLYLQNHLIEPVGPRAVQEGPLAIDGFSVCWFEGEEGFRRCIESPEMQEMDEDAMRVFYVDDILGRVVGAAGGDGDRARRHAGGRALQGRLDRPLPAGTRP